MEKTNQQYCNFWVLISLSETKIWRKCKLCYMGTDSFTEHIKTENIKVDIAKDVEIIFGTSNYELDRSLSRGKSRRY